MEDAAGHFHVCKVTMCIPGTGGLTFEELDALMAVLEMCDICAMTATIGEDLYAILEKLTEMRDEV